METNNEHGKDVLQSKDDKFTDTREHIGNLYYDANSRAFLILRLPALIKTTYPDTNKRRLKFKLKCFPDMQRLMEHLETSDEVPMLLNLYDRDKKIS